MAFNSEFKGLMYVKFLHTTVEYEAYNRCTNLEKKILPIVLPSMVKAENFPEHPRIKITWKI